MNTKHNLSEKTICSNNIYPFFLTVSNGRTGSTWLETSLGKFKDVRTDHEFKWKVHKPGPSHLIIENSCLDQLKSFAINGKTTGSKLVV